MTDTPALRFFDRELHATEAKLVGGVSPSSLISAYVDWAIHLGNLPGYRTKLLQQFWRGNAALVQQFFGLPGDEPLSPKPGDHRFDDPEWKNLPFSLLEQSFLQAERWWEAATTGVPGVARGNERITAFIARQLLDMMSPSNNPFLNPEVISLTRRTHGENLRRGFEFFIQDLNLATADRAAKLPMQPGKDVAITPGQVVFRNELIELIQYTPTTKTVRPEPLLIVPAWIMKYYILDLSPHDSLIKFLVDQGFTVFCISWLNPGAKQRDLHLDDYRAQGIMPALDAISAITGAPKIHALGYCLGGTLLTIAAAAMTRDRDDRLASLTLLAAQTDFSEAGELQLFINEAQLAFLDDMMWQQGYLEASQMAGAFQMLRSADLIWSRLVRRYFLGVADRPNDLMSWNLDATRMPYRMHSEYLWHMFQNNNLAEGRYLAKGKPVSLGDMHGPFFVVGTERDHIAPWRSVHKLHLLNHGEVTFVLASGGHNAGIVSEPGHPNRQYRLLRRPHHGKYIPPDDWLQAAKYAEGSWWPALANWLAAHSSPPAPPPPMGSETAGYKPLCAAPGTYVLQR
ncbi:MAG: alpha/beta fold hydrolase [Acidocella sp.]|nr:alpha/beta fold hydrolase [Acidocella sp.]